LAAKADNPTLFEFPPLPSAWSQPFTSISELPGMPMHHMMLGDKRTETTVTVPDWCATNKKWKQFVRSAHDPLSDLKDLWLEWTNVHVISESGTGYGGCVSKHCYVTFARVSKWIFGLLEDFIPESSTEYVFLATDVLTWTLSQCNEWFCHYKIEEYSTIQARDEKHKRIADLLQEYSRPPPSPELQPVPVSEIKDIIISQAAMIAHAMGVSEVTREAAVELHHHVLIFLSCID
jgi:hypothetical protein